MKEIKDLVQQSSHYLGGRMVILASGLISFPILTRIFSVAEYGTLGLINTTLFIAIAVAKLGFPNAIVRFYAEMKAEGRLQQFFVTILFGSVLSSAGVAVVVYAGIRLLGEALGGEEIRGLVWFMCVLIIIRCSVDTLSSFLRAEQRTKFYNVIMVVRQYVSLGLSIGLVLFVIGGLYGFYCGQLIAGLAALCVFLFIFRARLRVRSADFSFTLLKESVRFGFPLVWAELGHLILNYADRFLIQFYLGANALGLYTAGYNLSTHITQPIIYPINYAMTPIYMRLLVNKGPEATKEFFSKLFNFFSMIMCPLVFGFLAVGEEFIVILATEKYYEAVSILPYIVFGQAVYAASTILNCGLFIKKKTYVVSYIMIGFCLVNIVLNMVLIPKHGILGAAEATLISYIGYTCVVTFFAMREFGFRIEFWRVGGYGLGGLLMFAVTNAVHTNGAVETLLVKVLVGSFVYCVFIVAFDGTIRRWLMSAISSAMGSRSEKDA
jgi:O-antigen/teichoic acid export membrane protein